MTARGCAILREIGNLFEFFKNFARSCAKNEISKKKFATKVPTIAPDFFSKMKPVLKRRAQSAVTRNRRDFLAAAIECKAQSTRQFRGRNRQ